MMDVTLIRSLITATLFVAFLLIVYWAFGPGSKRRFDKAAHLPFDDDEMHARSTLDQSDSRSSNSEHVRNG